jgi:hypothetical protein
VRIAIVQSSVNGKWGYCPEAARQLLRLEYDDEAAFLTAQAAERAARADDSIPRSVTFTRYASTLQNAASETRRNRDYFPRMPHAPELAQIAAALGEYSGMSPGEAQDALAGARVAVFDHYITDCPGYSGRVALVLYSGGPELVECYLWRGEKCARQSIVPDNDLAGGGA